MDLLFFWQKGGETLPIDDRTKEAFERIEQGVKEVYQSDNFRQYLSMLTKFHDYSLNNTILILAQNPNASLVAGYNSWLNNFHRHVNQGEKAIQILAPYKVTIEQEQFIRDSDGNILYDERGQQRTETKEVQVTRFRPVNVFDVSQTDGEPLPSLVHELTGSTGEIKAIIKSIEEICQIPISYESRETDPTLRGGAKGYYSPVTDNIVVCSELEDLQKAKTLIHEYAHSILHKHTDKDANQKEIEAESLAFVICDYFGIDTSDYSFGYVASYAEGDFINMKEILNNIQSNAHEMIEKIEPVFKEKLKEFSNEIDLSIDMDLAHLNYLTLGKIAKPILTGEATYMRYSSPGYMDLILENIGDNRIAMAHYYELNGDLMADPDMEFTVDNENKTLMAESYQQDNLQFYERVDENPVIANDQNSFAREWLQNIKNARYKIQTIYTEEKEFQMDENPKELKEFCKNNNIGYMVQKEKEEKTR